MNRRHALGTLGTLGIALLDPLTPIPPVFALPAPGPLPHRNPKDVGLDPVPLAAADREVAEAVHGSGVPGAVLLVARDGATVLRKAYGSAVLRPTVVSMTPETVFDLASLTKVVATATAVAILTESGKIVLDEPVATYLPPFANAEGDRPKATVRHLLTHTAGVPAGGAYAGKTVPLAEVVENIVRSRQIAPPGQRYLYSDYSAIALQAIVEAVSGKPFDVFCRERIFEPLGMGATGFRPVATVAARCAATHSGNEDTRGLVHDPTARALGGVSGNAGLFSTADDLARFCQMMLNGGEYGGVRILRPETVRRFTARQTDLADGQRSPGWDLDSPYSVRTGFPPGSYGHTGFTGTSVWIDPRTKTFVLLLTNAVHSPNNRGEAIRLRRTVHLRIVSALPFGPPSTGKRGGGRPVLTGLEVLEAESFRRLERRRLGIVCNHTAVDRLGRHLVDRLYESERGKIVALFAPEHGIRGEVDASNRDAVDTKTGVPVYSLYNLELPREQRYRPTAEQLAGIDTLVFDIQDIGARFYTYIATLGYCLEEAAKHGIRVMVLDRPNPLGGHSVEGPLLEERLVGGFTTYHTLPVTHGMTVGELARMFVAEKRLSVALDIVPAEGWRRGTEFEQCELPWINPSPNIRNIRQVRLYPGVGMLETLPISVGRGTDTPFEVLGAPSIDPLALAEELNARRLPGLTFTPVRFVPTGSVHKGTLCGGVQIGLADRTNFRPVAFGIHLAAALVRVAPETFRAETLDRMRTMVGTVAVPAALAAGAAPERIIASWRTDVESWNRRRAPFLLYS
ncbi:MAG: DUF1343 domain-containing protein [Capsulimonadales bacterium]|nr:DUF1343 domain-containing protein [Capsulimonadales bacterium]